MTIFTHKCNLLWTNLLNVTGLLSFHFIIEISLRTDKKCGNNKIKVGNDTNQEQFFTWPFGRESSQTKTYVESVKLEKTFDFEIGL